MKLYKEKKSNIDKRGLYASKNISAGKKIIELPYEHPPDIEGMSKTAGSILRFCYLGFKYFIRIIQSLLGRN